MTPSAPLPSRRALALAAAAYLVTILAVALPRIAGSSWRSIAMPMDIRNLEGIPVQYEAGWILRSLHAMTTDLDPGGALGTISTDEYRAIIPIYVGAFATQLTGSHVVGVNASEILWWWLGAVGAFVFAGYFTRPAVAAGTGLLVCFTPLAVGHVGPAHLHTASSLSLSVVLAVAWRVLAAPGTSLLAKSVLYGIVVYCASLFYTYQWFLLPIVVMAGLPYRNRRHLLAASAGGTAVFLGARWASYALLAAGGLGVHSHQNDPIRVLLYSISGDGGIPLLLSPAAMGARVAELAHILTTSYGAPVLAAAAVGAASTGLSVRTWLFASGMILSLGFGHVYGIAWVLMSGYPLVYMAAAGGARCAILAGTRVLRAIGMPVTAPWTRAGYLALLLALGMSTNLDLLGDAAFALRWWRGWTVMH